MLGRLFGKNDDSNGKAVCAECGRTLLAGEWSQTIEDKDGHERVLCSLCGQTHSLAGGESLEAGDASAAGRPDGDAAGVTTARGHEEQTDARPGRAEPARDENAALWKAIKDRDAQIERLRDELARGEAERQELLGRLALPRSARAAAASGSVKTGDTEAVVAEAADAGPADAALMLDLAAEAPAEAEAPTEAEAPAEAEAAAEVPEPAAAPSATRESAEVLDEAEGQPALEDTGDMSVADLPSEEPETADAADAVAGPPSEVVEADAPADGMTLLQRGVDLLNVSSVPLRIAETNAELGIPTLHVGFDGQAATVTFMWSMGWHRYSIDTETGDVRLSDRGYDDRDDLQPNATVRADGTVHLAAARISRAATQREQSEQQDAAPVAAPDAQAEPSPERPAEDAPPPSGGPEILSKSLLGQRTDDERPSWEGTQARDFDWDR